MNWRAIGCGVIAAAVFVAVGLLGMSLAFSRFDGCPPQLRWAERAYVPDGEPAAAPAFAEGPPVEIGSTFIGLTTRRVYGPPGSAPSTAAADRPTEIVLECGDGIYQLFRWQGANPSGLSGAHSGFDHSASLPPVRWWVASAYRSVMPAT